MRVARAFLLAPVAAMLVAASGLVRGHGAAGFPAQQPQRDAPARAAAGAAVLAGVVTSDDPSGQPVRRAIVTLAGTGVAGGLQRVTDDAGGFAFVELPAGRYTLTAEKPGYVKTFLGSRRAGRGPATPLALADGQRVISLTISILRGAVIAGEVLDGNGVPMSSSQVTVAQAVVVNGERKLVDSPGWVTTDDRGRYRFYGLPPGEYTVRASGGSGMTGDVRATTAAEIDAALLELRSPAAAARQPAAAPAAPRVARPGAYYPAAADAARAEFFTLGPGEERTGVIIRTSLVRSARVEGMAVGPTGQPIQNVMIGIANASTGTLWSSPGLVRPGPDGRFALPSMLPARWVLFGRGSEVPGLAAPNTALPLWGETEFTVSEQDVAGIVMQFLPGASMSGRIAFRGPTAPPDPAKIRIALTAVPTIAGATIGLPPTTPQADGSFRFTGVAPGKYRLQVSAIAPWSVRSAIVDGRDTLDDPLDVHPGQNIDDFVVTLIDRPAEISGTMFDQLGRPTPEYAIVVFSTDRSHWTSAPRRVSGAVKLGSDGRFTVSGLPPGEYYLAALTDVEPSQLSDSSFLEQLASGAIKITLAEGERKVQDIKMGGT